MSAADLVPYWLDRRRALLALAVLVVVGGVYFGWQVLQTRSDLASAATQAEVLQDQLTTGDSAGAKDSLASLRQSTESARSRSDGVLWSLGSHVPYLGRNVSAIRTVSTEIDRVADRAAPPVVELAGQVSAKTFSPEGGAVDVGAVVAAAPAIAEATRALRTSRAHLAGVDPDGLVAPLRGPVSTLKAKVDAISAVATNADLAARVLPNMLGADGTRRYLLLNQNNAEVRSTGGIVGSYAVITIKKGKLSIGTQGSIQDMPPFDRGVTRMTDDELQVFPSTLVTDVRDVSITPDFPRTGKIARAMVKKKFGITVDGVVSIDPVALSYLLGGTGPVDLGSGVVLDQNNVVSGLLNVVYTNIQDTEKQDDLFALANRRIFNTFKAGKGDASTVLSAFVRGVDENRIMYWAAQKNERELLGDTPLAGRFATDDGTTPHVGVYLSDAASTKMEYYLDYDTSVAAVNCLDGGRQVISTTTDITSNAPPGAADLSPFITGTGQFVKKGSMRLNVRLVAPYKGTFTGVRLNDKPITVSSDGLGGRNVTAVEVLLKPGESATITANSTSGPGQTADPVFTTTPGIQSLRNDYTVPSACAGR